jgi:ferredoxin
MKVTIDADHCTGCEDCTQACPALFKLGGNWIAQVMVDTVPPELEAEARKTAALCQFEAIQIIE